MIKNNYHTFQMQSITVHALLICISGVHTAHGLSVQVTPTTHHYWKNIEAREEGGTPQIVGSIRAGLAMQLKQAVGPALIERLELECVNTVMDKWGRMPEVEIAIHSFTD